MLLMNSVAASSTRETRSVLPSGRKIGRALLVALVILSAAACAVPAANEEPATLSPDITPTSPPTLVQPTAPAEATPTPWVTVPPPTPRPTDTPPPEPTPTPPPPTATSTPTPEPSVRLPEISANHVERIGSVATLLTSNNVKDKDGKPLGVYLKNPADEAKVEAFFRGLVTKMAAQGVLAPEEGKVLLKKYTIQPDARIEIVYDVYPSNKTRNDFQVSFSNNTVADIKVTPDGTIVRLIVYTKLTVYQSDRSPYNPSGVLGFANAILSNLKNQNHPSSIDLTDDFYPPGIWNKDGSGVLGIKPIM